MYAFLSMSLMATNASSCLEDETFSPLTGYIGVGYRHISLWCVYFLYYINEAFSTRKLKIYNVIGCLKIYKFGNLLYKQYFKISIIPNDVFSVVYFKVVMIQLLGYCLTIA